MPRRKQQRPRPVKGKADQDDGSKQKNLSVNQPAIGIPLKSASKDEIEDDDDGNKSDNAFNTIQAHVFESPSLYKSQTTASVFSLAALPLYRMSVNEPKHHQFIDKLCDNDSDIDDKSEKCLLCTAQSSANGKAPVEGDDYFIDCDGTLSIRNGVCARKLVLSLISDVLVHRSKYTKLLGKNIFKFVLNLKQIVVKQKQICPGENPTAYINAENVLHVLSLKEKELHDLTNVNGTECRGTLKMNDVSRSESTDKTIASNSDASLNGPSHQLSLPDSKSSFKENNLMNILSQIPTSVHDHIYNLNNTGQAKSDAFDNGSTESISRVASPSSSMSSNNSDPSMSDRAKEIAGSKRGCKILPVASTDGQTLYLCPVCNLELSSDHELTIHIRSHNQSGQQTVPNTCTICGKTLSSQSSLDRHMLVHSGERPFKCKVCDMSFTTNGNMHRHARIHEKNGIMTPKLTGRKPIHHKQKEDTPFQDKSNSVPVVQAHLPSSESDYEKMDMSNSLQEQNTFFHPYYNYIYPFSAAHHPAFPYPRLMHVPFLQTMLRPLTGESIAQYIDSLSRTIREPSPDLRVQQKLHCTECDMVFSSQFTLESHMEMHVLVDEKLEAESGSTCKSCNTVAKSEASLLLHSLKYHKDTNENVECNVTDEKFVSTSLTTSPLSNCSTNNNMNNSAVGFENLGFANFTAKKFPLIAKAFCESYPSTKAVRFPVYKCKDCDLEFPVEGAKHLHEASHVPEEYTMCPKCNCHFSEPSRLQEHMQKHVSDMKFEQSSQQKCIQHDSSMLQYHFLAQFDLTPKEVSDQELTKHELESAETDVNERSASSHDDSSKVFNFDEDNSSELNQTSDISEDGNEHKTDWVPSNMHFPTIISDAKTCNNKSTNLMPCFEVSQKLCNNDSSLKCTFPNTSADSNISFDTKYSLLKVSNVSGAPVLRCKHCSTIVTSKRSLKHHLCSHKNASQFQCKMCTYSSADKNTLLRHMRVHSGERPYKCLVCDYSFTTKANCERHLRQKHGLEKSQLSEKVVCNKYILSNKSKQQSGAINNRQNSPAKLTGVDVSNWRSPLSRNRTTDNQGDYKCLKKFKPESSILQQNRMHHSNDGQLKVDQQTASENDNAILYLKLAHLSPSHAHNKSYLPTTNAIKHEINAKQDSQAFIASLDKSSDHFPIQVNEQLVKGYIIKNANLEKPLDFSMQQKHDVAVAQKEDGLSLIKNETLAEDSAEVNPIDLTIQKLSKISAKNASPDQKTNNKSCSSVLPVVAQGQDKSVQHSHSSGSSFVADPHSQDCTSKCTLVPLKSLTESDSSCEFASVSKILDVTDTHNLFNYLPIQETEDEQEICVSDVVSSDEDSSICSGNIHLQTLSSKYHHKTSTAKNSACKKMADHSDIKTTDSANMNEQAIAEIIEKISQQNGLSPTKKKKNSYADSPHKFSCPFCPRCFPWHSSLNRHLLTHTGQKPFKCPQCPVIFSTKSNRERHLIRKHNVNMLDPASRSTMDRPYKCHICMFSSFSTHNNLMKHYKDKHAGAIVPSQLIGADKQLYDIGWEDSMLNGNGTSYEDEEEYNSLIEMQGRISDKEVMYENYAQDSDSNQSSNSSALLPDTQSSLNSLPFQCNFCPCSFNNRLESLQHLEHAHQDKWTLTVKNDIENIQVFSTKLEKIDKIFTREMCEKSKQQFSQEQQDTMKNVNQIKSIENSSNILSTPVLNHQVCQRKLTDTDFTQPNSNHPDMLQDLLGVESSTIDQILESSDSAVSLLGVYV